MGPIRVANSPANQPRVANSRVTPASNQTGSVRMNVSRVARQGRIGSKGIYDGPTQRVKYDNVEYLGNNAIVEESGLSHQHGALTDHGLACGDCGACDLCQIHCPPYQLISFADMEYSVGVQGFKSVPNLGQSGSFGFNESINWGFPFPILPVLSLSGQIGFRFTQSDMNGANFTADSRDQLFLTGGISRRVDYGLQLGVAVDYLNDNWYFDSSFAQMRTEIGLVGGYGNQFGFRFSANLDDDAQDVQTGLNAVGFTAINNFEPVETYRFFYRHAWDQVRGGHAEFMAGFAGNSAGVLGADFLIPISERWALNSNFSCLLPSTTNAFNQIDESWNVGLGLTWYPKGLSTWSKLYHRPLFDVADNGTFMFQR